MAAILDDPALVDSKNAVAVADGREPVRDDEHRASLHDPLHALLDDPLALVIQSAGRFVKNENARIHDQRTGNGDPLPLPSRQAGASLAHIGVIAIG